jgi:hypothetical protein
MTSVDSTDNHKAFVAVLVDDRDASAGVSAVAIQARGESRAQLKRARRGKSTVDRQQEWTLTRCAPHPSFHFRTLQLAGSRPFPRWAKFQVSSLNLPPDHLPANMATAGACASSWLNSRSGTVQTRAADDTIMSCLARFTHVCTARGSGGVLL